jgi:hypothetical protein
VSPHLETESTFSFEQTAFACLLVVGFYFPTSTNGEHSVLAVLIAFSILLGLLVYLAGRRGVRWEIIGCISLPIVILPAAWTLYGLCRGPVDVDLGLFLKYCVLALVLALDLRKFRPGRLVNGAVVLINLLNLAAGVAILAGSEWMAEFLPRYYWTAYSELVPLMVSLHKPVLTFGTHSMAAFFVFVLFWINWEGYISKASRLSLFFALGYFVLLLGLTSFTSVAFGALALVQMGTWFWKRDRRLFIVSVLCVSAVVPLAIRNFADALDTLSDLPQMADGAFLNTESNGPVSRYGPDGSLSVAMAYLRSHPFLPIGLARAQSEAGSDVESPSHFFIGDSGILEYLLRGSFLLLFLVYFGLYRFLKNNLVSRKHLLILFFVTVSFETGFPLLIYFRTLYLLPFFVVSLREIELAREKQWSHPTRLAREWLPVSARAIP